jgi:uncharacterized damage-inducible protein DinB
MSTPGFLHDLLTRERGIFRKVVAAVLEDGREYRPDPKGRSSSELIGHLIGHNLDLIELLDDGVIHHRNQVPFDSVDDAVGLLDRSFATLLEKLAATTDDRWMRPGKFFAGEQLIAEAPCSQLAWMLILDAIHHRGQLSTHLRPMGSKVPAIYGPSADDQGDAH